MKKIKVVLYKRTDLLRMPFSFQPKTIVAILLIRTLAYSSEIVTQA